MDRGRAEAGQTGGTRREQSRDRGGLWSGQLYVGEGQLYVGSGQPYVGEGQLYVEHRGTEVWR